MERRQRQWNERMARWRARFPGAALSSDDRPLGRMRKKHPFDCGCSGCAWCHPDKYGDRLSRSHARRNAIASDETA